MNGQASLNGATQTLPAIFAAPAADFHDITTGSTQFQSAGPGYDLATGRGSPVANLLVPFLATYGTSGGTGSGGGTGGGTGTTTVPAAPSNFTAQAIAPTEVSLSWSASTGAMGYKVYEQVNGQAVLIGTLAAGTTSFTVNGLSPSTIYSFEVAAYNTAGATATSWTQVKTPTPVVTVTAPTNVAAAATSPTAAQVSWHAVTSATGYVVYEWNGSQAVQVAAVGAGVTSASIANQKPGSTEYFYVAAYNPNSSAASGWVSLVMPVAALVPPASLSASATSATSGKLSWSASAGATGYAIYYRNGAQTILLGRVSSGTTAVTIQGLPANSTSYFAIVAINGTTTSGMSNWVALKTPAASLTRSKTAAEFLFAQAASEKHPWWMNY